MKIGDTYYWKDGGHLWVVISDPSAHNGFAVAVNLTTDIYRAGKDCELNVGDHKWITKKSYVSFGDAMKLSPREVKNLEKAISAGQVGSHFPMKDSITKRIVAAGLVSKSLSPEFKKYL